jgi:1-piperideine-2-carboxylate/1-pyrroline-2-carboxylate reductase [NAD(P)H]
MSDRLLYLSGPELAELVSLDECVEVLERSLREGSVDPEADSPRLFSDLRAGEFLLMPTEAGSYSGVKVVTVAPGNPAAGHPKIQGVYALFDSEHLRPLMLMDAAELTLVRTPATTALAVRHMLAAGGNGSDVSQAKVHRLSVLGTGPQALRHVRAITAVIEVEEVVVIGRRPSSAAPAVESLRAGPYQVRGGDHEDLVHSDVIVCATSSSVPVFDDAHVAADAVICAVGAHGLNRREIPAALTLRSDVVVEGRGSAMREAGNLIPARSVEEWSQVPLTNLAELVAGRFVRRPGHPALYSGVGMAWEDIVVAGHIYGRWRDQERTD